MPGRNSRKILPEPDGQDDKITLEIRPKRFLRIIHRCISVTRNHQNITRPVVKDEVPKSIPASDPCFKLDSNTKNEKPHSTNTYTIHDAAKESVIFLIHGVGGCAEVWKEQIEYFSRLGFDVVVPDLIGHGFSMASNIPGAYHFKEIAADMLAVFDKFHKKSNYVIGHSYGTSFATVIAEKRSSFVDSIVLVSGGGPNALAPQPGVFNLPICLLSCIQPLMVCGFMRSAFKKKTKKELKVTAFDIPTYVLKYIMQGQDWLEGNEDYHKRLALPALLICGDQDPLVEINEELEMKETIKGAQLVVLKGASHMVMIECPVKFNELVVNFIKHESQVRTSSQESMQQSSRQRRSSTSARSVKSIPASSSLLRGTLPV